MHRISSGQSPTSEYSEIHRFHRLISRVGRVKTLSNVLRDIDDVLPQRDLTPQQRTEVEDITRGCRDVLEELEVTLDKYQELDPNFSGPGGRSRRVWKRLRWDQKAIDGFRSRITSNVLLFNTFLERISRSVTFPSYGFAEYDTVEQYSRRKTVWIDWSAANMIKIDKPFWIGSRQLATVLSRVIP